MAEIISLLCFVLAVAAYGLKESAAHGKIRNSKDLMGFWGIWSWKRKYVYPLVKAPDTWYYRTFKIEYKEKFPGSATIFVFITDGMHFSQTFFKLFLCTSVVAYRPILGWYDAVLYWILFGITFTLSYKIFSK